MRTTARKFIIHIFISFISTYALATPVVHNNFVKCTDNQCRLHEAILPAGEKLKDQAIVFETSPTGFMQRSTKEFSSKDNGAWYSILIEEDAYTSNFPIIGFGGAFTDSAAILFKHLSPHLQQNLLRAYFSYEGNAYSLGRVPMASADFSCREKIGQSALPSLGPCSKELSPYTYADKPDASLSNFALAIEDIEYKIPFIKAAFSTARLNQIGIRLFASPWSAPAWMKDNGKIVHGSLLPAYQASWANYFIKFLQAYKLADISFWGITVQNEPEEHTVLGKPFQTWQTMFYTAQQEADFVKKYLGPAIRAYEKTYGSKIAIIMHDDQIDTISDKSQLLEDLDLAKHIAGLGLHWYKNSAFNYSNLDPTFAQLNKDAQFATRFILSTEACEGFYPFDKGPKLGDWGRAEAYATDIISDLNHHVSGWTDWNLLLDMKGGPNWAENYVDAAILVDIKKQELYLQPIYYYLAHFSRYIRPGAKQLNSASQGFIPLEQVSFKVPAYQNLPATIVTVVLNRDRFGRTYFVQDHSKPQEQYLHMTIPAHSIQTIIYKAE